MVLILGKYFYGCSVSGKVFFWVVQKYPTPLIPVCMFINSTPWEYGCETKLELQFLLVRHALFKLWLHFISS